MCIGLFSSDYPYWSPGDCLAHVRGAFDGDDLDAILFGNATSLLGLDPA